MVKSLIFLFHSYLFPNISDSYFQYPYEIPVKSIKFISKIIYNLYRTPQFKKESKGFGNTLR